MPERNDGLPPVPPVLGQRLSRAATYAVALALAAACSTAVPEPRSTGEEHSRALAAIDEAWFRTVVGSDLMKHYLAIPTGSIHLAMIPSTMRSRLAMIESFLQDPSWPRIWHVAALQPDEFSGIAALNYLRRNDVANFVAFQFKEIENATDTRGFEAAVFAHIEDERSRPSRLDPRTWVEDAAGYHHNAYSTCAEFLARRSQPCMAQEWERLARFTRNSDIRALAKGCLNDVGTRAGAEQFSQLVAETRRFQQRFLGLGLFKVSIHEVLGEKREVRDFEMAFLGTDQPAHLSIWEMTGLTVVYETLDTKGFLANVLRGRGRPQWVRVTGGTSYLDKVQDLLALLEKGQPGEVSMPYARFLIVPGVYSQELAPAVRELESALPPYTCFSLVTEKQLFVLRVLNENLDAARKALDAHASRPK